MKNGNVISEYSNILSSKPSANINMNTKLNAFNLLVLDLEILLNKNFLIFIRLKMNTVNPNIPYSANIDKKFEKGWFIDPSWYACESISFDHNGII